MCEVPGCRRSRGQHKGEPPIREDEEWICGEHWKAVPSFLRRRKSRLARRYRRAFGDTPFWQFPAGSPDRLASFKLDKMLRMSWAICKRAAIERAVGIR